MNMIGAAILSVSMFAGGGNASTGSESVSVVKDIDTCRAAMVAFKASKADVLEKSVRTGENWIEFQQHVSWQPNRHYVIQCKEF
jgi:hypothetical protein